jgi:hypothetical protein
MSDKATPLTPSATLVNGAKAIGEITFLPGLSLVVDGDVKGGLLHAAVGAASVAFLGPFAVVGWAAAAADSYSKSVTGQHIHELFRKKA